MSVVYFKRFSSYKLNQSKKLEPYTFLGRNELSDNDHDEDDKV